MGAVVMLSFFTCSEHRFVSLLLSPLSPSVTWEGGGDGEGGRFIITITMTVTVTAPVFTLCFVPGPAWACCTGPSNPHSNPRKGGDSITPVLQRSKASPRLHSCKSSYAQGCTAGQGQSWDCRPSGHLQPCPSRSSRELLFCSVPCHSVWCEHGPKPAELGGGC